ncbi:hypothetical protein IGM_02147 [Bacillus cereus HuB4-4]|uniref:Uncharacterized protein n=1 Tax=Bacillus cereus HuB4-4 TaxID=1053211 RepID=A0A9W5QWC0_BACCE|nr:hypothetical protein IGM_02147 [Bacillus cereus HuB4-4]
MQVGLELNLNFKALTVQKKQIVTLTGKFITLNLYSLCFILIIKILLLLL